MILTVKPNDWTFLTLTKTHRTYHALKHTFFSKTTELITESEKKNQVNHALRTALADQCGAQPVHRRGCNPPTATAHRRSARTHGALPGRWHRPACTPFVVAGALKDAAPPPSSTHTRRPERRRRRSERRRAAAIKHTHPPPCTTRRRRYTAPTLH